MTRCARLPAASISVLALLATAQAATLCVNPGGTGGCFASIQAAVDTTAGGDTISIAAGTYVEGLGIPGGAKLTLVRSAAEPPTI